MKKFSAGKYFSIQPVDYWGRQTVPVDANGMLLRPGVNGGMFKKQQPEIKPRNYFAVESISDYLAKIQKVGGKVTSPKNEVPNIGWVASAVDPEGNPFAIVQLLQTKP